MFDRKKFDEAVERSGLKGPFIAKNIGISYKLYQQKSLGNSQWKVDEALAFSRLLRLRKSERDAIFFAKEVAKTET